MYGTELLPLLQSLLADLADLDFEHESDVETIRTSTAEEWLKQAAIRRERCTSYMRQLEAVQERVRTMAA
jgi:hypothetical protein